MRFGPSFDYARRQDGGGWPTRWSAASPTAGPTALRASPTTGSSMPSSWPRPSPTAPRPVRWPVMYQTWSWLTFLHWSYEPAVLARLLPAGLRPHTFDGRAWVGLTPFLLQDLRTPVAPAPPWFTSFPETNVRTYVVGPDGRDGLWFFSLDAARLEPVLVARSTYALPYMWSAMTVERDGPVMRYRSRRRWPGPTPASSAITLEIGAPLAPEELGPFDRGARAVAAAPGGRAPAGRQPDRGCRPARPPRASRCALVTRGAEQDQRPATAQTSLTA